MTNLPESWLRLYNTLNIVEDFCQSLTARRAGGYVSCKYLFGNFIFANRVPVARGKFDKKSREFTAGLHGYVHFG